jgi:hypothetical protein
MNSKTFLNNT